MYQHLLWGAHACGKGQNPTMPAADLQPEEAQSEDEGIEEA
jgi:hypothetical protein